MYRNGIITLADIGFIDNLNTFTTVNSNTTISGAAELLMDVHNPFLIYESNEDVTGGPTTHEVL